MRLLARSSLASAAGTAAEAAVYYLVLAAGGHAPGLYGPASALGAACGGITNFVINRYWAFHRTEKPITRQAMLYALASLLTYLAMLGALAALVEVLHVPQSLAYPPSKIIAWLGVSYPMARFVVFGAGARRERVR
ncbi:MAG: GtrA family protein [Myxococcales bacterium]